MKKDATTKISFLLFMALIFLVPLFFVISASHADDEGEGEDNYRRPVQVVQPQPPIVQPQPIIIQQPQVIEQPVVQQQPQTVSDVTPQPTKETTVRTTVSVPDNSAVLAALKDSDKDGVPDVIDKYPGEDDFAFALSDKNNNGIADDLEMLIK